MSKKSYSIISSNPGTLQALVKLGQRLRANRVQQGWTVDDMANRLFCSPTTYRALEAGKPGTSIGMLVNALWLFGEIDSLDAVAPIPAEIAAGRRVRHKAGKSGSGIISEQERDF